VLYNMCNIGAVMRWCFDCTNKGRDSGLIGLQYCIREKCEHFEHQILTLSL